MIFLYMYILILTVFPREIVSIDIRVSLNHSLDEPRRSNDIARRIVETCIFRERKLEARKKVDATEGESETEKEEHDGLHPTSSLVIVVRLPPRSHDEERTRAPGAKKNANRKKGRRNEQRGAATMRRKGRSNGRRF